MTEAKEGHILTGYPEINKIFGGIPRKNFWCFRFRDECVSETRFLRDLICLDEVLYYHEFRQVRLKRRHARDFSTIAELFVHFQNKKFKQKVVVLNNLENCIDTHNIKFLLSEQLGVTVIGSFVENETTTKFEFDNIFYAKQNADFVANISCKGEKFTFYIDKSEKYETDFMFLINSKDDF